jgi:hypothetical protein
LGGQQINNNPPSGEKGGLKDSLKTVYLFNGDSKCFLNANQTIIDEEIIPKKPIKVVKSPN